MQREPSTLAAQRQRHSTQPPSGIHGARGARLPALRQIPFCGHQDSTSALLWRLPCLKGMAVTRCNRCWIWRAAGTGRDDTCEWPQALSQVVDPLLAIMPSVRMQWRRVALALMLLQQRDPHASGDRLGLPSARGGRPLALHAALQHGQAPSSPATYGSPG